ncbi:MAG: sulfite exporter TauE/SafE family protein [Thiotrichales bacterium]|jgi:hypothetical protein|nr:sulfite exporter TauE/SafE family protein [Thiotrichales bacterium]
MFDFLLQQVILFIVSLSANAFSALAGGGAGLLQFPALLWLGLPFAVALATHKVASVALGVGATIRYLQHDVLSWRFAAFILLTGLPGVWLGAISVLAISEQVLLIALGLLTIGMGAYSIAQAQLGLVAVPMSHRFLGWLVGGLGLFVVGVLNGSLTSGTGLFVTLWLVRWFGLDYKQAVAYTLVLVGFFWNGLGGLTLAMVGEVRWDWLPVLLVASMLGGYLGAHWALLKGNLWVKRAFEVVTILTGASLLIRAMF